jgi:hypothetical protein
MATMRHVAEHVGLESIRNREAAEVRPVKISTMDNAAEQSRVSRT